MPFAPGNKLSPGRPTKDVDVVALARKYTTRALEVLAQIMEDDSATAASRVTAADALLSRGHGRPAQAVVGADGGPLTLRIEWVNTAGEQIEKPVVQIPQGKEPRIAKDDTPRIAQAMVQAVSFEEGEN